MPTGIVRPNANYVNQWALWSGSGDAWERVDDNIEQPTAGGGDAVHADDDDDNDIEEFDMTTLTGVVTVTAITAWVYANTLTVQPTIDVYLGGYLGAKTCTWAVETWTSYTWSGLSGTQAQLDAIRVKFVSAVHDKITNHLLDCVYLVITYTVPSGYSHKFCGVLPANIGKISGVATANIGKVKGV